MRFQEGISTTISPGLTICSLAAETRIQLQVGGHIEPVGFFLIELAEQFLALADHHVAGCASAVATAGMFEVNSKVNGHIQQRLRLTVLLITKPAVLIFDRLVAGQESYANGVRAACVLLAIG